MDMIEKLGALAKKMRTSAGNINTEEATKNALIMPFLSIVLGYDVFDPTEVVPEFTADVGIKKGEKVDYAIMRNGQIQMLIECKKYGELLGVNHASQLYRYFSVTPARIAILTNGIRYQFFTDLDNPNKMDDKPYLELDLDNVDENIIPELSKLTKKEFDVDVITNSAGELKYLQEIKKIIGIQFVDPEEEFVRLFISRCYNGKATRPVVEQFKNLASIALAQFISDKVNERLKSAIKKADNPSTVSDVEIGVVKTPEIEADARVIEPSEDELMAYNIVRAILCQQIGMERVFYRVAQAYLSIFLDNTNRKPICRFYLKKSEKFIGIINDKKEEMRRPIVRLDEIYQYANQLLLTTRMYENPEVLAQV